MRQAPLSAAAPLLALCLATGGCSGDVESRNQWLITVSTDAIVPRHGDRLLVELIDDAGEQACAADESPSGATCRRLFGAGNDRDWPLSFGVAAPGTGGSLRVRARLFRSSYIGSDGLPAGDALIEATARLPDPAGRTNVSLKLSMNCFGVPAELAQGLSCDATTGVLAAEPLLATASAKQLVTGSWPPAVSEPCAGAAPSGMVCVPGGAFLLGDFVSIELLPGLGSVPERTVKLSPFFLDIDEVTVGQVRQLIAGGALALTPTPFNATPGTVEHACTYLGPSAGANDALPVNCVDFAFARAACQALDKRLPTEAEWEYVASRSGEEARYPWGESDDVCARAVIARGRTDLVSSGAGEDPSCRSGAAGDVPWGVVEGGSDADIEALGVRNLAGNLAEWVQDQFAGYDEPCWADGATPLVDPVCGNPAITAGQHSVRGSSWISWPLFARAHSRLSGEVAGQGLGFRCARSN